MLTDAARGVAREQHEAHSSIAVQQTSVNYFFSYAV